MPKSGMTRLHGKNMFNFIRNGQIASNVVVLFCIPINNVKISSCSTYLSALGIIRFFLFYFKLTYFNWRLITL